MTDQPKPLSGDPVVINEVFRNFHAWHRLYVDDFANLSQRGVELCKQIASFHERLLLVSLGTLGLSVTALTSFVPKIPAIKFPKYTFVLLIAPAWVCLMASAIMSASVIAHMIVASQISIRELRKVVRAQSLGQVMVYVKKLSASLSGTVSIDSQNQDAPEMFSKLAEEIENEMRGKPDGTAKEPAFNDLVFKRLSRCAMLTLYLGLILLCISAIKLFLSL